MRPDIKCRICGDNGCVINSPQDPDEWHCKDEHWCKLRADEQKISATVKPD